MLSLASERTSPCRFPSGVGLVISSVRRCLGSSVEFVGWRGRVDQTSLAQAPSMKPDREYTAAVLSIQMPSTSQLAVFEESSVARKSSESVFLGFGAEAEADNQAEAAQSSQSPVQRAASQRRSPLTFSSPTPVPPSTSLAPITARPGACACRPHSNRQKRPFQHWSPSCVCQSVQSSACAQFPNPPHPLPDRARESFLLHLQHIHSEGSLEIHTSPWPTTTLIPGARRGLLVKPQGRPSTGDGRHLPSFPLQGEVCWESFENDVYDFSRFGAAIACVLEMLP